MGRQGLLGVFLVLVPFLCLDGGASLTRETSGEERAGPTVAPNASEQ